MTAGEALRDARKRRGLTLQDVEKRSRGAFKVSAVGAYERGERNISLSRFIQLASVIGVPADDLVRDTLSRLAPDTHRSVVIDLDRLSLVERQPGRIAAQFVHDLKTRRGDVLTNVITLRSGDVAEIANRAGMAPRDLLSRLAPSLRRQLS